MIELYTIINDDGMCGANLGWPMSNSGLWTVIGWSESIYTAQLIINFKTYLFKGVFTSVLVTGKTYSENIENFVITKVKYFVQKFIQSSYQKWSQATTGDSDRWTQFCLETSFTVTFVSEHQIVVLELLLFLKVLGL